MLLSAVSLNCLGLTVFDPSSLLQNDFRSDLLQPHIVSLWDCDGDGRADCWCRTSEKPSNTRCHYVGEDERFGVPPLFDVPPLILPWEERYWEPDPDLILKPGAVYGPPKQRVKWSTHRTLPTAVGECSSCKCTDCGSSSLLSDSFPPVALLSGSSPPVALPSKPSPPPVTISIQASVKLDERTTEGVVVCFKDGADLTAVLMGEVEGSFVVPTESHGNVQKAVLKIPVGKWQMLALKATGKDNEYWISETKSLTFFRGFTYTIELPLTAKIMLE